MSAQTAAHPQPHPHQQQPQQHAAPTYNRRVGKYLLGKTLGQGTFGKVKQAVDTVTGQSYALKAMDKAMIIAQNMGDQIKKEIAIMKQLTHPNIVALVEVLSSPTTIYLVLELVTGGELFDAIMEEGSMSEDIARTYFSQLISGLEYCHARGVCHRDLKPENLLLDATKTLKISDFGLSALASQVNDNVTAAVGDDGVIPDQMLHTICGTPNYVAPEVLMDESKGYNGQAADIWSAGVILYVLLAGFPPFDESSMVELFRKIVKADFKYPSHFTADAKDLVGQILNPDPNKRATIAQIKAHRWMNQGSSNVTLPSLQPSMPSSPRSSSSAEQTAEMKADHLSVGAGNLSAAHRNSSAGMESIDEPLAPSDYHNRSETELFLSLDDGDDDVDVEHAGNGAIKINAFDLINMVGGAAMSRMFRGADREQKTDHVTQFTSADDVDKILSSLQSALSSISEVVYRSYPHHCQIRVLQRTLRGKVLMLIQLYEMTPKLHMIECRKMKGDIFAYHDLYREIKKRIAAPHSRTISPAEEDKQYNRGDDDESKESTDPTILSGINRGSGRRNLSIRVEAAADIRTAAMATPNIYNVETTPERERLEQNSQPNSANQADNHHDKATASPLVP